MTSAIWLALDALQAAGVADGLVEIHEPHGQLMALVNVNARPWAGNLTWTAAPVYTISYDEIVAAAAR
jgi:hypothetical protein